MIEEQKKPHLAYEYQLVQMELHIQWKINYSTEHTWWYIRSISIKSSYSLWEGIERITVLISFDAMKSMMIIEILLNRTNK